ncbi:MAG: hypothetical protein ACXW2U_10910 [Telluria sp.]
MGELNKQQLCAALSISESTVRRLEQRGLPYTPVGVRSHRYNLAECKVWLRANEDALRPQQRAPRAALWKASKELEEQWKKVKLRVMPSAR